jgi:transposase
MPQALLPIFLEDCVEISELTSYRKKDGVVYYFHGALPIFSHSVDDGASFRMFTSQMIDNGSCRVVDVQRAFGVSETSVKRHLAKFRAHGVAAFFKKRAVRGAGILSDTVTAAAQSLLDEGRSRSEVASELGLNKSTLAKGIARGLLSERQKKTV